MKNFVHLSLVLLSSGWLWLAVFIFVVRWCTSPDRVIYEDSETMIACFIQPHSYGFEVYLKIRGLSEHLDSLQNADHLNITVEQDGHSKTFLFGRQHSSYDGVHHIRYHSHEKPLIPEKLYAVTPQVTNPLPLPQPRNLTLKLQSPEGTELFSGTHTIFRGDATGFRILQSCDLKVEFETFQENQSPEFWHFLRRFLKQEVKRL